MAKCTICGAKAGFMMSVCDSCIQASAERRAREAEQKRLPVSPPTDRELLERILELVLRQQAELAVVRWRVGCLFAWLLLSVVLGVLAVLAGLHH
jgi:hypothetical protein